MTPDVADLQARVAYLSDELARAKMALASPGCGEACPVQRRYVEAAVRATIEAAAEYIKADRDQNERTMSDPYWNGRTSAMELVTEIDPAPINTKVLEGSHGSSVL